MWRQFQNYSLPRIMFAAVSGSFIVGSALRHAMPVVIGLGIILVLLLVCKIIYEIVR